MLRMLVPLALAAALVLIPTGADAAPPDTARARLGPAGAPEAWIAHPPGDGPAPAVIVLHERLGPDGQAREMARRLSRQGYVALVPDLTDGRTVKDAEAVRTAPAPDEERALATLAEAVRWLRRQPRTARSRIGVIGFGAGAALAQQFAMSGTAADAVVIFYGTPETRAARVSELRAPLQAHFGATDAGIGADQVEAFRSALGRAGKTHEVHVYAGAGAGFVNEQGPSHNSDAARLAWVRMLAFLQKHLKG